MAKNIAIWGTSLFSLQVYCALSKQEQFRVILFVHNDKSTVYGNLPDIVTNVTYKIYDTPIVSVNELRKYVDLIDYIVIPKSEITGQYFIYKIRKQHISFDKFIIAYDERLRDGLDDWLVPYMEASYLPYLEFHIEDRCNLNCKGCEHFAPLVPESRQPDPEKFRKDLLQLKKFIKEIHLIRILGGEPLLNDQLDEYIFQVREIYPYSQIHVVTNGLLLKQIPEKFYQAMRDNAATIDLSYYPVLESHIDEISDFVASQGVEMNISPKITEFFMKYYSTEVSDKNAEYERCMQGLCHNLYDGKIGTCFLPFTEHYLNEAFQRHFPEDEAVDLYDPEIKSAKDLKKRLYRPLELCKYCGANVGVKWQRVQAEKTLSDYLVR